MNVFNHLTSIYRTKQDLLTYLQTRLGYSNLVDPNPSSEYGYFVINTNIQAIRLNDFNLPVLQAQFDAFTEPDDFETELYPELLDNTEQTNEVKAYINNPQQSTLPTWSDDEKNLIDFVEKYNKNVLLLRATKKTRVVNELDVDSGSGDVNLTGVENQLRSISDKLETSELVDGHIEYKNITKSIQDLDLSNQTVVTTVESAPYNPLLSEGEDIYDV